MSINTQDLSDLEEIDRLEQAIQTFIEGRVDPDRFTAVRLQQGVYGQRQDGVNMLRIKIPGGRLNADQLDAIADVTETFSQRGIAHLTTRQAIQVHFIPLAKMPSAMRRLARVNMTTREACGNTVRNMSACALSGVCPKQHVDVAAHVDGATQHFLRNPLNQQMPRKFKISFSACESDCAQSLLHDAGVIAIKKDGQPGFRVKAGGGLGHKPRESIVVEEFIPESELLFSLEALVTLHNKYSDRTKRAKSRIKFLVERFGVDGFLEKYREEFERTKRALAGQPYPKGVWQEQTGQQVPGSGAPRKLFAQRQAGLFVLPVALSIGDVKPAQLRGIAGLLRVHGLDEVHTTQDQNLIILNVPENKLAKLRSGLAELDLHEPVTGDNVVACPGTSTCRLGITASTVVAPQLSGGKADLRIRVSGCHNGCAQPETGDIGIYGEGKRMHGKLVPHYQMYFGGDGTGGDGTGGKLAIKGPSLPVARVKQAIARVQQAHLDSGEANFFAWVRAQQPDYFKQLLADLGEVKAEELHTVMHDYGEASDFRVLQLGGGECAGASQVLIGANFFEAAHERAYRNALVFQRKYDEAAQCNEAILRLLGSGLAQLLGGVRQDDLDKLSIQLQQLLPGQLADELARIASALAGVDEISQEELAIISAAVDDWTVKVATFAMQQDAQLDLTEAAAGLTV
ncbi:MAG: Sulfite reductase (Ferredoxin) [Candidatus Gallionella acididurans]|uniref:Sulfite reductase (Ferredoxin) n=1 Tax=Candidatus Gallionella acididurans TaxID=1796491 RepID=A0A139BXK4_9PROT|nr:MAG: Sulfite reductase (Ferredoxin) [Candidatus Gallionella acididurans]